MAPPLIDPDRIKLLEQAAELVGGKAQLGRALGYKDGAFVGQMLRGERPVSEKTLALMRSLHALAPLFGTPQIADPVAPAPPSPPDLAEVLVALGNELAKVPASQREAAATLLAGWARDGGADHWRGLLLQLLQSPAQATPWKRTGTR